MLDSEGVLIDLRPLLDRWPLEVESGDKYQEAGRVTDLTDPLSDDQAATNALAAAADSGSFLREREEVFPFFYYWDTPGEMREYISETWSDVVQIEDGLWNDLRSLWAISNADARVRLRVKLLITRWRKRVPGSNPGAA